MKFLVGFVKVFSSPPAIFLATVLGVIDALGNFCMGEFLRGMFWLGFLSFAWIFCYIPHFKEMLKSRREYVTILRGEYEQIKEKGAK